MESAVKMVRWRLLGILNFISIRVCQSSLVLYNDNRWFASLTNKLLMNDGQPKVMAFSYKRVI